MNIKAKTGGNNGAKPGDNLSEIIGKNISRLRNKLNMSQEDLSNRLFVSKDLVSKWETGARRPDWTMIEELAEVFGVPVDEIADRNELTVDELEKCLPEKCTVPEEVLVASLNDFLGSLRENEANIFMQRYYFLRSAKDIAAAHGLKENHVRSILAKTRSKLKRFFKSVISEM